MWGNEDEDQSVYGSSRDSMYRRSSSGNTLNMAEFNQRVASVYRNEADFGWSDSAGGVRSGDSAPSPRNANNDSLSRQGSNRAPLNNANAKLYRPVFAPSDTLEEVEVINSNSDQPIPMNSPNSPMGRKVTLKEKIGAAFSRGMGTIKRANTTGGTRNGHNPELNKSSVGLSKVEEGTEEEEGLRRPNLARTQSNASPQSTPKAANRSLEKATESEKEESGFGGVVRRLSRRATTGSSKKRKRKLDTDIPPSPPLPIPPVPTTQGQRQERLSRVWQNLDLPEIPLYRPPASANVPNAKALSSFAPRAPLVVGGTSPTTSSTARTPPLTSPPAYTPGSTRRKQWEQFNISSGDLK